MIRAILFDMDGVLIDSEPVHQAAVADALTAVGLPPLAPGDYERVFLGRTDWLGFPRLPAGNGASGRRPG